MKVSVKLYALLRKYHPGPNRSDPFDVELPEGAVIADVLPALNLPAPLVYSVSLNNQISRLRLSHVRSPASSDDALDHL